ncbi:hypothetical protein FS837_005118 [Tulasnella sp. UAMH 9824]|nr:hypothetical protein FS837_005118 [Tulasnella sp. UAMH 9824]
MAERRPVSYSAAPPLPGRRTAQQRSEAPTTPSMNRRSSNTVVPNGLRATSAPEMRTGYRISNTTPHSSSNIATSSVSEGKLSLDQRIQHQLTDSVVVVETNAFVEAVLYKGAATRKTADEVLAGECLRTLGPLDEQPTIPTGRYSLPPTSEVPTYKDGCFTSLRLRTAKQEEDVYPPLVRLLNYVRCFFCNDVEDVDAPWSSAQEPTILTPTEDAGPPLSRVFRDTHDESRGLKPDICLLVEPTSKPEVSQGAPGTSKGEPKKSEGETKGPKGKRKTTATRENIPKPTEAEKKSKPKPHWKDVRVVIEVKKKGFEMKTLVQVAQYARSMMLEQEDRNFVLIVLMTGDECRVFHWDAVGAQVTKPFNIHKNPKLFLQVMGRLATMTPSELGYDTHFSNAGRVLSTETITTHLTIRPTAPRYYLTHDVKFLTAPVCPEDLPPFILELKTMQFESKCPLFGRWTRWRDKPGLTEFTIWSNKTGQMIADPTKGFLHTLAADVAAVPKLQTMEECAFTSSFRGRFNGKADHGILSLVKAERMAKYALKRECLFGSGPSRSDEGGCMSVDDTDGDAASDGDEGADGDAGDNEDVADQKGSSPGRPPKVAENSIELLQATVQWIQGQSEHVE